MLNAPGLHPEVEQNLKTVYWLGNCPGNEQVWHEPSNWSNSKLPDSRSFVYIPKTAYQPILSNGISKISALEIEQDADMQIGKNACLEIDGSLDFTFGVRLEGSLTNRGKIRLVSTAFTNIRVGTKGCFQNFGTLETDEDVKDVFHKEPGAKIDNRGLIKFIE